MAPLKVGALAYHYQSIDVIGPIDIICSASRNMAEELKMYAPVDEEVIATAPDFEFHHLGVTLDPVPLTAGVSIVPTCTLDDAPELDILILGGPDPERFNLDERFAEYIRKYVASGKLLFTNCTGAFVAAKAGALDGRTATVNHAEFEHIKSRYPKVNWTNETKWVVDGNIWTASGAVAGMDMVAHWVKENYGLKTLSVACRVLDYEPRNINGVLDVFPKRYDASGKQISTHVFDSYSS